MAYPTIQKEVVVEGRTKVCVEYIRRHGINQFLKYALSNLIPYPIVAEALSAAGVQLQPNGPQVYARAITFYRNELARVGLANAHKGIGIKETIKRVSDNKFRASFLVDANLNLMPEMVINPETGLFVPLSKLQMPLQEVYKSNFKGKIYQALCAPVVSNAQGAYIIEVQNTYNGMNFDKPEHIEFYQPLKIDTSKNLDVSTSGMLTTKISCQRMENKTLGMLNTNNLLMAIRLRVMAELHPEYLGRMG